MTATLKPCVIEDTHISFILIEQEAASPTIRTVPANTHRTMIKITNADELHRVLARLDNADAVWESGHKPSSLESALAEHLRHEIIIVEMRPYYDPQSQKLLTLLRWSQPVPAEEFLK